MLNGGCKLWFLAVGLICVRSCWNIHVVRRAACTLKFSLMPVSLQLTSVSVTCSQCSPWVSVIAVGNWRSQIMSRSRCSCWFQFRQGMNPQTRSHEQLERVSSLMYSKSVQRTNHLDFFLHADDHSSLMKVSLHSGDMSNALWLRIRDSCLCPFSCFQFKNKRHLQC